MQMTPYEVEASELPLLTKSKYISHLQTEEIC